MNEQQILLSVGGIGAAALACQWLAWRLKLPAILFLLLAGIIAGPALGWLDPEALFGPLLMPLVSLAVALILFEGSLTLHLSQWREIGSVVHRLVTVGALVTWLVIALATHWLLGFDWPLSILFGTLTLVTGPTVIVPMLRVVRPKSTIANILRWEGIMIDPIGALLAVVVYSFIIASADGNGLSQSLTTFAGVIFCGSALGAAGGWLLGQIMREQWLPEYLHNLASLAAVLGIFIAANQIMHESGLLAVTVMGMWLANMRGVDVRQILHFKENLSVLLISGLFILLAARLDLHAPGVDRATRYRCCSRFGDFRHPPAPGRPRGRLAAGTAHFRRDHRHGGTAKRHGQAAGAPAEGRRTGTQRVSHRRCQRAGPGHRQSPATIGLPGFTDGFQLGKHSRRAHGRATDLFWQPRLAACRRPPGPGRARALAWPLPRRRNQCPGLRQVPP